MKRFFAGKMMRFSAPHQPGHPALLDARLEKPCQNKRVYGRVYGHERVQDFGPKSGRDWGTKNLYRVRQARPDGNRP